MERNGCTNIYVIIYDCFNFNDESFGLDDDYENKIKNVTSDLDHFASLDKIT